MFDIGWRELLVIGALALIVVGPKDLPGLLRSLGQWVNKIRSMARDFQRSMNDAAAEADLKEFRDLANVKSDIAKAVNPLDFTEQAKKGQSFLKNPVDAIGEFEKTPKSDAADADASKPDTPATTASAEPVTAEPSASAPAAADDKPAKS